MKSLIAPFMALALVVAPAAAKQWKPVEPFAAGITDNVQVVGVDVAATGAAASMIEHFDKKAGEKKAGAEALKAKPASYLASAAPSDDEVRHARYAMMPFSEMVPLVMTERFGQWNLTSGRPVRLKVTVDTFKTANAGMALLGGSSDQFAGMVEICDAATHDPLGSFYVDVRNSHGGLLGLAMRGSGVRESLVDEFALESSRALSGRKSKNRK